jgi:hypothetical protein
MLNAKNYEHIGQRGSPDIYPLSGLCNGWEAQRRVILDVTILGGLEDGENHSCGR